MSTWLYCKRHYDISYDAYACTGVDILQHIFLFLIFEFEEMEPLASQHIYFGVLR